MSDIEDADFCVESWSFLGKKDSKKKDQKLKNIIPKITQPSTQKVKKKSKFKEAMLENKERKKEKRKEKNKDKKKVKKKKKNKSNVKLADHMVTQSNNAQAKLLQKLALINQNLNEKLNPDHLPQDSVKEAKRKKHVAFGLLPSYIRVKRPHFASLSPKEAEVVREGEKCSQVILEGQTQNQPHDDFQCASDDINSQDLFITQKTFRASPSSSEISDRVASPRAFEQQDERQEMDRCQTKADKCPQDAHQHVQEPTLKINTEEDEGVYELHQWEKMSFRTQMKFNVNLPKQEEESVHVEPKVVNLYLDKPFVINPTPDVASCLQHVSKTPLRLPRMANSSTQTENFFSTELSFYLDFCQNRRAPVHVEDLKPLDLSLPHRARKALCLSAKMSAVDIKADANEMLLQGELNSDRGEGVSTSPQVKHVEIKADLSRHVETTPSPQSETDTKSADMTASSEDDQFCRSGKRDLLQVGAVQLRLNKPFFFKTKGDGLSPRPESPLMKLSQGRDKKSKKRR